MQNNHPIPFYSVDNSYEIVYRKSSTSAPAKPHTHNAMEIYFTLTDLPDVLLNDTVSSVAANSLIVIPPHTVHQLYHQKETVYERYIVTVNSHWLEQVLNNTLTKMHYAFPGGQPSIISLSESQVSLLSHNLSQYLKKHKNSDLPALADFFALLDVLNTMISEGLNKSDEHLRSISRSQQNVNEIISYINLHLTEPLSLESVADEFHMNKDYMGRLFKSHTQATIGHYIAVQRVNLAQTMLAEGHTVTEVQEALGFSSYAYFFKYYKKMTGISPSQYRKTNALRNSQANTAGS